MSDDARLIDVAVRGLGETYRTTGRSVDSIARREFGRKVQVRPEHSEAFDPAVEVWMVTRTDEYGTHVLGRIVAPGRRGRGRPPIGEPLPGVAVPAHVKAAVEAEAMARGVKVSQVCREVLTAWADAR